MACTEFYTIRKKDGRFIFYDEVPGAMRGAYLIWHNIERKYLPSLPMEDWMVRSNWDYYSRFLHNKREELDEFWNLDKDPRLSWQDRILLGTTTDYAVIRKEDLLEVAEAYENCEFASDNMKGQAEVMRRIYNENDKSIAGVYKLETSVISLSDIAPMKRVYCYLTSEFYDCIGYLRGIQKEIDKTKQKQR